MHSKNMDLQERYDAVSAKLRQAEDQCMRSQAVILKLHDTIQDLSG